MRPPIFLVLHADRVIIQVDSIIAVDELSERDIDARTGRLPHGIPEDSLTRVHTTGGVHYLKATFDELVTSIEEVTLHG